MTGYRGYITKRTRVAASLGVAGGILLSAVTGTLTVASLYYALEAKIARAQTTADAAAAAAADAAATADKRFDQLRADILVIQADVKTLLQRK